MDNEDKRVYEMTPEEQIIWADNEFAKLKESFKDEDPNDPDIKDFVKCHRIALESFAFIRKNHDTTDVYNDDMLICDILKTLFNNKPLTDITDDESEWTFIEENPETEIKEYQSKRCYTLSKFVSPDGTTKYYDTEYAMTVDLGDPKFEKYWDTNVNDLMLELFPITMPYNPVYNPVAYIKSTDDAKHNNVFELVYVMSYTGSNKFDGLKVDIGKYFDETDEISYIDYLKYITSI